MEGILKIVFFWLGVPFVFVGLLSFAGIMKPKESSMVQDQAVLGMVFTCLGIAFLVVYAVLKALTHKKDKLHNELLEHGMKVNGRVEKVYLQKYTQYGNTRDGRQSPYRILYSYTCQGKAYRHKSCLLWEKPECVEGDPIVVYANDQGKSTLRL